MTPEQFSLLLKTLERIANQSYTITGAADWPAIATVGGLCVMMIGWMWVDLRSTIKDDKIEATRKVEVLKDENDRDHDDIWTEIRRCQGDCCPRRDINRHG